jgi:hypothetical protein
MRKLMFLPVLLVVLLLTTQSCTKQSGDEMRIKELETITAVVSVSNPYVLNVNNYSDISIGKQAEHADISKTEVSGENGTLVYRYVPKVGYTGADEVELAVSKTSYRTGGGGCNSGGGNGASGAYTHTSRVLIKFTVTN